MSRTVRDPSPPASPGEVAGPGCEVGSQGGPARRRSGSLAGFAIAVLLLASFVKDAIPASERLGSPVGADAPAYCRIAKVLLRSGSLELPPPDRIDRDRQQGLDNVFGTPYALSKDGRLFPKHSWAFALLLAPGFSAAGTKGALAVGALLGALLAWFVTNRVAGAFGAGPAFLGSLALFVLTPGGRYVATAISIDTLLALGLVLAFAFARGDRPVLAGLVAGFMPLLRPSAPLLLIALPLLLFRRGGVRSLGLAGAGALPGALVFAGTNAILWGGPLTTAYERVVYFRGGEAVLGSHLGAFSAPTLQGLGALLLAPSNGFLAMAPIAAIALLGYFDRQARDLEWSGAAMGAAAGLLLLSGYAFVAGGGLGAFRFGFPLLVTATAPLAALLREFGKIVAGRKTRPTEPPS